MNEWIEFPSKNGKAFDPSAQKEAKASLKEHGDVAEVVLEDTCISVVLKIGVKRNSRLETVLTRRLPFTIRKMIV